MTKLLSLEEQIRQSEDDIKCGRVVSFNTKNELLSYLDLMILREAARRRQAAPIIGGISLILAVSLGYLLLGVGWPLVGFYGGMMVMFLIGEVERIIAGVKDG